jgi:dGTPase
LESKPEDSPPHPGSRTERYLPEHARDRRTDAERDRDRVLYSAQFARLAEITQVISPENGYVFHNRLTHSLKVAQIARRISQNLLAQNRILARERPDLPDVAEAAALAHDLGHPPFGHAGEKELNRLVQDAGLPDGFEGNAQSFRILTKLAASDAITTVDPNTDQEYEDSVAGLNWCRQCLDAVMKYPWGHGENPNSKEDKWGFYDSEREEAEWVRKDKPAFRRSLGAEIIDWADDITYAIHDLLDFFRAGSIPIERLRGNLSVEYLEFMNGVFRRKPDWASSKEEYKSALSGLVENFPFTERVRFVDSSEHRRLLYQFATDRIRTYVDAIKCDSGATELDPVVNIERSARRQVDILKQFTWHYIIEKPELALPQAGQRRAIRTVFRKLLLATRRKEMHLFPTAIQDGFRESDLEKFFGGGRNSEVRVVADYVAGMTEKEVIRVFQTLEGHR